MAAVNVTGVILGRKRLIASLLLAALLASPFLSRPETGVFPLLFHLALLPVGLLAYLQGVGIGAAAAAVSAAVFLLYISWNNVQLLSVAPTLVACCITPLACGSARSLARGIQKNLLDEITHAEKAAAALADKDERLGAELKKLDAKVSEITGLYEITKQMSTTLLFGDIFQIMSEFLRKNFTLTGCKLILVSETAAGYAAEKIYKIDDAEARLSAEAELIDHEIVKEVGKKRDTIYYEGFIAIPLLSHGRVIGVLNVEGLEESALERFLIVARQFALEIEKVRLYETVQALAITDGLTGVFVRRYFLEKLKGELERSERHNFALSFLMIDLDHFKECNDTYGHLVGDVVLKDVARVLRHTLREIDLVGRYGGEEFSVLLPETDSSGAVFVAERLREAVAGVSFKAYDQTLKLTISIGVATFHARVPGHPLLRGIEAAGAGLIEAADRALYKAKAAGRNRVET